MEIRERIQALNVKLFECDVCASSGSYRSIGFESITQIKSVRGDG